MPAGISTWPVVALIQACTVVVPPCVAKVERMASPDAAPTSSSTSLSPVRQSVYPESGVKRGVESIVLTSLL
jgi:hypothetical protein